MDNKKNKSSLDFRSDFLSWDSWSQIHFITQFFLSKSPEIETTRRLLGCLDECPETTALVLITTLFSDFDTYRHLLIPYIQNSKNPETIRLLMLMNMTLPHQLDEETIACIVSLYMDPADTPMEPVVEIFVHQHPELVLPCLIQHALKPNTAIRSQQLLQLIGQTKIKAVLGDLGPFPQLVVDCIKQIPPHPRSPKPPGI